MPSRRRSIEPSGATPMPDAKELEARLRRFYSDLIEATSEEQADPEEILDRFLELFPEVTR